MNEIAVAIFKKYGIRSILFVLLVTIILWGFAHFSAAPDKEVSILWGIVKYTKKSTSFANQECIDSRNPITAWGIDVKRSMVKARIATNLLNKYAEKYNVILICRVQDNTIEPYEDTKILKSAPFFITGGNQLIEIPMNPEFLKSFETISKSIQYRLCLIPKGISIDAINKINDVEALGGIIYEKQKLIPKLQ